MVNTTFGWSRLDGAGSMVWNQTYGGTGDDNLYAYTGLSQSSDGGYAMTASTTSYGAAEARHASTSLADKNRFIRQRAIQQDVRRNRSR